MLWNFPINNVILVKIEGPVWYTIYHHLPVVKGVSSNPSINQPTNGKRTSMFPIDTLPWQYGEICKNWAAGAQK